MKKLILKKSADDKKSLKITQHAKTLNIFILQVSKMAAVVESGVKASLFQDLKLKRRRLQDLLAVDSETYANGTSCAIEADLQSNTSAESSESGYGSQSDFGSVTGRETRKTEDFHEKEEKFGATGNMLYTPPPYRNDLVNEMHLGVAYLGLPPGLCENGENGNETLGSGSQFLQNSLKMGLVPMFAPISGLLPMTSMGFSGLSSSCAQNTKAQPLFLTTMPRGFVVTSKGPVPVAPSGGTPQQGSANNKRAYQKSASFSGTDDDVESRASSEPPFKKHMTKENETEFINHYTNGAFVYLGHMPTANQNEHKLEEKTELKDTNGDLSNLVSSMAYYNSQPMTCAICHDKATGLHYGIITCEG